MFIKDVTAISPQSYAGTFKEVCETTSLNGEFYSAVEPDYQDFIPLSLLRRMGKAVRMGIGVAMPLLQRNDQPDGIIIGTANGGLENCILFLNQIVEYNEGLLTPTNFVQSTPNALAGQLAIMNKNNGYNATHVNGAHAFENALIDADLCLEQGICQRILVGAVEEISTYNYNIDLLAGRFKAVAIGNNELLTSGTPGTICGEGSTMFLVDNNPEGSIAEVVDVLVFNYPEQLDIPRIVHDFLLKNKLAYADINLLVTGKNGDSRTDFWYEEFVQLFPQPVLMEHFKDKVGEYRTSVAYGLFYALHVLHKKFGNNKMVYSIIYNHFDGEKHSLLLLKRLPQMQKP